LSKDVLCEESNWKGSKIESILSPHFPLGNLENVSDSLEKNQLNINLAEETLSLLKTLRFIHQNGYAHCNITKESIYLDEKGHLHLRGFDKIIKLQKGKTNSRYKCDNGVIGYRSPEISYDNFTTQFFDSVRRENLGLIVPLFGNMLRHSLGMPDRYINEYSDIEAQKSDIFSLGMILSTIISGEKANRMLEQMKTFEKQIQESQDLLSEETSQRISDRIYHKEKYLFQENPQIGQDSLSRSDKSLEHLDKFYNQETKYIQDKIADKTYLSLNGEMLLFFLNMTNPEIDQRPDAGEALQSLEAFLQ
jgi:serine/threonine protein kinase